MTRPMGSSLMPVGSQAFVLPFERIRGRRVGGLDDVAQTRHNWGRWMWGSRNVDRVAAHPRDCLDQVGPFTAHLQYFDYETVLDPPHYGDHIFSCHRPLSSLHPKVSVA